jgi:diguanylate cyclase (GGDEF)-like protein/PAS domain S-box-containing protein
MREARDKTDVSRLLAILLLVFCSMTAPALAIEPVPVPLDTKAIDLTTRMELYSSKGDRLQVSTAPDQDKIVRRIEVSARQTGTRPSWIVFALANETNEQIERLIVAPHFRLAGSGVIWPDLGASRIAAITASQGFPPDREDGTDADVFRITLDPGTIVTYVAELRTPNLPKLYLWQPDAYKDKLASLTLYQGIVIGIAALLALFLTIVFVVKGAVIFPAAAALAWAVLAYVCIDFGFWTKLFGTAGGVGSDQVWRAGAEAVLAATLLVFLFAYLNLNRWHVRLSHVTGVWLLFLTLLAGLAVYDAPVAAGVARISLAAIALVGFILVIYLAAFGYDRAVMLIPAWLVLVLWIATAALTVTGRLTGELAQPALIGGMVLIVMLIGFTVMQNAFASGGLIHGAMSDIDRRALAQTGSGDQIFDWDVPADHIFVSPDIETSLGLRRGGLEGPATNWLDILHPFDRDRYRACLDAVLEQRRGRIGFEFRLRSFDSHYHWYLLKARPVVGADGEVIRVIGTLADVTESKTSEERILYDAVRDNLTGLPNREIFNDRLETSMKLTRVGGHKSPAVFSIDIDRFRQVNENAGMPVGNSVLLTIARRLLRLMRPQDTLARLSSDQFALIVHPEDNPEIVAHFAESLRSAISTPVSFNDREVTLTASIGISVFDPQNHQKCTDILNDAEIAVVHAKRLGGNRIEFYRPAMRAHRSNRQAMAQDLSGALQRNEISIVLRPIVRLEDRTIAGFEAVTRWDHPRFGRLPPADFLPIAEENNLIADIAIFALDRTAHELAAWQQALDVRPPIFATVNITSSQLMRHDLLHDIKAILTRIPVAPGTLKLEVTENLILENPEYASQIMKRMRELGLGLALEGFGAGHSSLSYLHKLPLSTIKVDRGFARQDHTGTRPAILRSMISMAHDLGADVIIDGAESESDSIELYQLGAEYALGQAFGNPMSVEDARRIMGVSSTKAA